MERKINGKNVVTHNGRTVIDAQLPDGTHVLQGPLREVNRLMAQRRLRAERFQQHPIRGDIFRVRAR